MPGRTIALCLILAGVLPFATVRVDAASISDPFLLLETATRVAATDPVVAAAAATGDGEGDGSSCNVVASGLDHLRRLQTAVRLRVIAGSGREGAGTTTLLSHLADKSAPLPAAGGHARRAPPTVGVWGRITPADCGKATMDCVLVLDVESPDTRPTAARCVAKLAAIAASVADLVILTDFESVGRAALDAAESVSRFAEIASSQLAAATDADTADSFERLVAARQARTAHRSLILVASKADVCDPSSMAAHSAEVASRVSDAVTAVRGVVARDSDDAGDADTLAGTEAGNFVGVVQFFTDVSTFVMPHSRVCGGDLFAERMGALRKHVDRALQRGSVESAFTAQSIAADLAALVTELNRPNAFPALPQRWLQWIAGMADAAVEDGTTVFRRTVRRFANGYLAVAGDDGSSPTSGQYLVAAAQPAALPGMRAVTRAGAVDANARPVRFTSKALVTTAGGAASSSASGIVPKTAVPSLDAFDTQVAAAAHAALAQVKRRLFRQIGKRRLAAMGATLKEEAERSKAELRNRIDRVFSDFVEDCARHADGSEAVAALPTSDDAIKAWHGAAVEFCVGAFESHLSPLRPQMEKAYDQRNGQLRTRLDAARDATQTRSNEALERAMEPEARAAAHAAAEMHLKSGKVIADADAVRRCEQASQLAQGDFTAACEKKIAPWAVRAKGFAVGQQLVQKHTSDACRRFRGENRQRFEAFGRDQVVEAATLHSRALSRVAMPVDATDLRSVSAVASSEATRQLRGAFERFSAEEVGDLLKSLDSRMQRQLDDALATNTKLWNQRLASVRQCAAGLVQDEIFEAGFFSLVHYSSWWVKRKLTNAVWSCAAHTSTAVPDSVLYDVTAYWLTDDRKFAQLLSRAEWNQKAAMASAAALVGVLVKAVMSARQPRRRQQAAGHGGFAGAFAPPQPQYRPAMPAAAPRLWK